MKCPFCGSGESHVIDTRSSGERIRRRRECTDCGERFTTYERVVLSNPMVVKRDGRREEFDPDKLASGVRKACAKRRRDLLFAPNILYRSPLCKRRLSHHHRNLPVTPCRTVTTVTPRLGTARRCHRIRYTGTPLISSERRRLPGNPR